MIRFLDNLNQGQLSRALGHLLKLAWAGVFHRLPFPSRRSHPLPTFPLHYLSLSLSTSRCWGSSHPRCASRDSSAAMLCVPEADLFNEIIYVLTPCRGQAQECYPPAFLPRNAKVEIAFPSNGAHMSYSLTTFAETQPLQINALVQVRFQVFLLMPNSFPLHIRKKKRCLRTKQFSEHMKGKESNNNVELGFLCRLSPSGNESLSSVITKLTCSAWGFSLPAPQSGSRSCGVCGWLEGLLRGCTRSEGSFANRPPAPPSAHPNESFDCRKPVHLKGA